MLTCPSLLEPNSGAHFLDSFQPPNHFFLKELRYGLRWSLELSGEQLMKLDIVPLLFEVLAERFLALRNRCRAGMHN